MCAGASTYEALDAAGMKASDRVGVVGLGGLGHMAVLFARAMGCAVTVFSRSAKKSDQKVEDAFALGADQVRGLAQPDVVITRGEDGEIGSSLDGVGEGNGGDQDKINVLLVCANEAPDLEKVLPLLARRATVVLMSIQSQALSIPYMPFVLPGHRIIASTEASTRNHLDMIQFAARHRIRPWVESFAMTESGLQEAFTRLESGKLRYRGVLVASC